MPDGGDDESIFNETEKIFEKKSEIYSKIGKFTADNNPWSPYFDDLAKINDENEYEWDF